MVGQGSAKISPIMSSAIVHHQIEKIHPFAEGNGRAGRMLSVWELFRRGSTTITFSRSIIGVLGQGCAG
jgi:Fic family protein